MNPTIGYSKLFILFILLLIASCENKLIAQPGTLDLSFGDSGKIVSGYRSRYFCLALQGDAKIIVAGQNGIYPNGYLTARYDAQGNLDSSFGENGIATTNVGGNYQFATGVAIQQDGKIVEVGSSDLDDEHCILIRYLKNGRPDGSFGKHGVINFQYKGDYSMFNNVLIQPDGKIVCAGRGVGVFLDFLICRFNANGTSDSSFGKNGATHIDFFRSSDYESDCALLPDGKILVAGNSTSDSSNLPMYNLEIARFLPDGQPDKKFGYKGKVISHDSLSETASFVSYRALGVQSNGRIIVAGSFSKEGSNGDVPILKAFKYNGEPDSSFGINGVQVFNNGSMGILSLQIQEDDKIICAGTAAFGGMANFGIFRLLPNGVIDSSFGNAGFVTTAFPGHKRSRGEDVVLQSDNKIILCGYTDETFGHGALARYNNDLSTATIVAQNAKGSLEKYMHPGLSKPCENVLSIEGLPVPAVNNLSITDEAR